ncbi:MAG: hypothetical protein RR683_09315 [Lachnospiraceae bacterium]
MGGEREVIEAFFERVNRIENYKAKVLQAGQAFSNGTNCTGSDVS